MQAVKIMQLLIILALLLGGPRSKNIIDEVKPVLENFGDEQLKNAVKEAEQISGMLSALQQLIPEAQVAGGFAQPDGGKIYDDAPANGFPLQPVINLADRDIAYSLSKYLSA